MKLKRLKISNFRSYDPKGVDLDLGKQINIIVGKNNAGKSTILHSLSFVKGEIGEARENHFAGERSQGSSVEIRFNLDASEIRSFLELILKNVSDSDREEIVSLQSQDFPEITYRRSVGGFEARVGPYPIKENCLYRLSADEPLNARKQWTPKREQSLKRSKLVKVIEEVFGGLDPKLNVMIEFRVNLQSFFTNLVNRKLKIFPEFRIRPGGGDAAVTQSLDGTQVASVLNTLKNGTTEEVRKWRRIEESFSTFYPSLILDVRRPPKQSPQVWVEKRDINYDVTIEKLGAGISEFIVFLTNLIDSSETVFCLDNPEIHFHPHAQRKFLKLLERYSQKNQFILVSHSQSFVKPTWFSNLTMVRERNGRSMTHQPKPGWLTKEEELKLERDMTPELQEIFFCDLAVFVEGPTEVGALPIFAKSHNMDFDEMNVSIVRNSGMYFDIPIKICKEFDIPFLVMCDRDALMNSTTHFGRGKKKIKCSPIVRVLLRFGLLDEDEKNLIYDADSLTKNKKKYRTTLLSRLKDVSKKSGIHVLSSKIEEVLKKAGYSKYFKELKGQGIRSKPITGRYVAKRIVENKEPIPDEILDFLDMIVAKHAHT